MQFSDEQRRLLGVGSILSICVAILAIQIRSVLTDSWAGEPLLSASLEVAFPALLTLVVAGAAIWFLFAEWPANRVIHIARWTFVAVVVAVALESWVLGVHVFLQDQTASYVTVTNTVLLGLVAGGGVGVYSARQREGQRELTQSEQRYRSLTEDVLDSSDVGLFILDSDLDVVWVNEATERYFDLERESVIGRDARTLVDEHLKHQFERPERFAEQVTAAYDDNTGEEQFECHVVGDGDEGRWLEHSSHPIESGLYRGGRIEHYTDITERKRTNDRLEAREQTLRRLHDVLLDRSTPLEDRIDELLDLGLEMLDVEHAVFAQVSDGEVFVQSVRTEIPVDVQEGYAISIDGTYAKRVVESNELRYATHVSKEWPEFTESRSYQEYGLEYYVGVPVRVEDDLDGVLAFGDPEPREETAEWELALLDIMANSLAHELEHRRNERRREQELQETREQFESLVEDVEDYAIFRLSPDGHVESWNRGAEDIKGYSEAEIIGEHVRSFHTEEDREADRPGTLLRRAAEKGRAIDEGWRVRKDGSRFWANVVITALEDDDGELRGFLKVTRDITERREREQQIEHERERLEFMNRIIRHNLLNGMNVVDARARLLEGHVDEEMATHLGTIQTRIADMIDLIETMRAFMRAIVEGKEHDPEPMALDTVLDAEMEKAADAYDHARFEWESFPSVEVLADDLLPEVFENLLTNAVQHNDKETPAVEVRTEVTPETVAVEVRDNGPGIDEELRDAVFEKGRKGFDSPGTGFGLYLVREIIDSYGGRVEAENGPDGGAVFTVYMPRVD
ncbi:PAS domain S-box protein [Haloarchaeobius sp. HME9146]|uniref:PAS domain S-box protein n=1 Tax=Haloarchaeobius sp. HME9146 TaxID=2978732 RepID=UPI0021BEE4CC|nr:PAS domain S-box protein [Haloarchaeobius sp. HME9146]MCT9095100.1 PAS domain S-box protein [Haloarchaeobius sp. HME9146]